MISKKQIDVMNLLFLFIVFLSIQFSYTQIVAILSLIILLVINLVKKVVNNDRLYKTKLFLLYSIIIFIFYLVRPPYIYELGAQMEVFWLLIGVLIVFTVIISEPPIEKTFSLIIYSSMIGGFLTLLSYFGNMNFLNLISPPYAGTRAVGGFDGPNELATFHLLTISLCFGLILEKKHNYSKLLLFASIIISGLTIFFSFSRGGLVGLAVTFCIFGVLFLFKRIKKFIFYFTPLISIAFFIFWKYQYYIIGSFNNVRRNRSERGYLTDEVIRLFSEAPLIGKGLGSFSAIANVRNTVPHNDFYVFIVSGGIIALLFFILFLTYLILKAIKIRSYSNLLFLVAFITQAMTFNHLIRGRISIIFWIVVTILLIANNKEKLKGDLVGFEKLKFKD